MSTACLGNVCISGILTLVILFTGMFLVVGFSKFWPWYLTRGLVKNLIFKIQLRLFLDFEQKDISRITVWTGGRYCANEFENSGMMMTGIYQTGLNGHNLSRSGSIFRNSNFKPRFGSG